MNKNFEEERQFVLNMAKQGIDININLNSKQKKYIKNLLLFALMNASSNKNITDKNFIELVNKLFKTYLVKILKESLDDDDEDWDDAISVEINKIIANDALKNLTDFQEIFTPTQIFSFLKKYTKGISQKDLLTKLSYLKDEKDDYNNQSDENKKRKNLNEMSQRDLLIRLNTLKNTKSNYRETPDEERKREQNRRIYSREIERQRIMERSRGARTR